MDVSCGFAHGEAGVPPLLLVSRHRLYRATAAAVRNLLRLLLCRVLQEINYTRGVLRSAGRLATQFQFENELRDIQQNLTHMTHLIICIY